MFSSTEEYTIETLPLRYTTKRKATDFEWLRDRLVMEFPGVYIPPAESKGDKGAFLQNFLNSLIEREELRNTRVLQDFLSGENLKQIYKSLEPKNKTYITTFDDLISNKESSQELVAGLKERNDRISKKVVSF